MSDMLTAARAPGVTDNAILLLGYVAGALMRDRSMYEVIDVDAVGGFQVIECVGTGNTFRVSILQLSGPET